MDTVSQTFVSKWEHLIPLFTWQLLEGERGNGPEVAFRVPVVRPPVWSQTQEPRMHMWAQLF